MPDRIESASEGASSVHETTYRPRLVNAPVSSAASNALQQVLIAPPPILSRDIPSDPVSSINVHDANSMIDPIVSALHRPQLESSESPSAGLILAPGNLDRDITQEDVPQCPTAGGSSFGTLVLGQGGTSKYLGPSAASEWLKDVSFVFTARHAHRSPRCKSTTPVVGLLAGHHPSL